MGSKKRKILIITAVTTGSVFLVLLLIFGILYFINRVSYDEVLYSNVQNPVFIERNEEGIPLIKAQSVEDAYLALGYVHATDRLFLMEYFRAIARSNISRLLGNRALPLERLSAGLEISVKTEKILTSLPEKHRLYLDAYAKGVNLARKKGIYRQASNREWDASDIIAILLVREWSNAFLSNRELLFPLPEKLRNTPVAAQFPRDLLFFFNPQEEDSLRELLALKQIVSTYIGTFNRGFAAYITASQTTSGMPMTLFSMDNSMSVYPSVYPVMISIKDRTSRAVSVAGLPFIFAASTPSFDYYGFSMNCDSQEFFLERYMEGDDHSLHLSPRGARRFRLMVRQASYGSAPYSVRLTDNGPVVRDILGEGPEGSDPVTLHSLFPEADYVQALFNIPESDSLDKARLIVQSVKSLPRIYLLGDAVKSVRILSGRLLTTPGDSRVFRRGDINAGSGEIIASYQYNSFRENSLAGSGYMDEIPFAIRGACIPSTERYERLKSLIFTVHRLPDEQIRNILIDTHSLMADKFTPLFLDMLRLNPVTSARLTRIYFTEWDRTMVTDQVAPSIYRVLLNNFIMETLGDDIGSASEYIRPNLSLLTGSFLELMRQSRAPLFDNITTDRIENMENTFDLALMKTMRFLNRKKGPIMDEWKWGSLHRGVFHIPVRASVVSYLTPRVKSIELKGSSDTIFEGTEDENLNPVHSTALSGCISSSGSVLFMNFACSIDPMSDFYYGKMKKPRFTNFHTFTKLHQSEIKPASSYRR